MPKIILVCMLLVSMFLSCQTGLAQSQTRSVPAKTCLILIDGSASPDPVRLAEALVKLREAAPALARAFEAVQTATFSDEGAFTKLSVPVLIPSPPKLRDCSGATVVPINIKQDPDWWPGIREYKAGKNMAECSSQNKAVERQYRSDFEMAVGRIRTLIPETVQPQPGCTAIATLMRYALSRSPSAIVILTDGEETCSSGQISRIQVPAGTSVAMFLVPKKAGPIKTEGPEALKRGAAWKALMLTTVLPYTDISTETISVLLAPAVTNGTTLRVR